MYNGIGLETVRGSGTNGYVQRNLGALRRHKDKVDYKSEEELKKLDAQLSRGPNQEILDHERKRKVELKCMEMQELMEEQGYGLEEIDRKVSAFREMLMNKSQSDEPSVELDDAGRPIAKATHQMAEANQVRNDQLKMAFGIGEFYKEGSAFDKERKAKELKEEAAKNLAMAKNKYTFIQEESSSSESESEPEIKKEKKKKKTKKRSPTPSSSEDEHEKSRKSQKSSKEDKPSRTDHLSSRVYKAEHSSRDGRAAEDSSCAQRSSHNERGGNRSSHGERSRDERPSKVDKSESRRDKSDDRTGERHRRRHRHDSD